MIRNDMILAIAEAARCQHFTDEIEDIENISYTAPAEDGEICEWSDRFDYIDTTSVPISVHVLYGGTDTQGAWVPLTSLTTEALEKLYKCIER